MRSLPASADASSGPRTCRRSARACGPTPSSTSTPRRRSSRPPSDRSIGPATRSATGSASCRRRRARSSRSASTRPSTRRSPTTANRPPTARDPASTTSTPMPRRPARGTRPRPSRSTSRSRAPSPARDRAGAPGSPRVPAPPGTDGVRRGVGPLHRAPVRRDGPLHGRPRPDRRALVRCLAGVPAGRRHGHARAGLDAAAGHRLHARAHHAGREQHRERGGPLHHDPRPGPGVQDRPARDPAPSRRGAGGRSAPGSTSGRSTTPCWGRGRWASRRSARTSGGGSRPPDRP